MGESVLTCVACGTPIAAETGSDLCSTCASSGLGGDSTRVSEGVASGPAEPPSPELSVGLKLVHGRFTLLKPLGRGGMGEVWLAADANLRTHAGLVALKFLTPHFRRNARAMDLLREELEASRELSHDNILRIHDLQTPPGEPPFIP